MFCDIIKTHEKKKQTMKNYLSSERYNKLIQNERNKRITRLNEIFDRNVSLIIDGIESKLGELIHNAEPEDYPFLNDNVEFYFTQHKSVHYKHDSDWLKRWDETALEHEKLSFSTKVFEEWLEDIAFSYEKSEWKRQQLKEYIRRGSYYDKAYPTNRVLAHLAWRKAESDLANVGIKMSGIGLYMPKSNKKNLSFTVWVKVNLCPD